MRQTTEWFQNDTSPMVFYFLTPSNNQRRPVHGLKNIKNSGTQPEHMQQHQIRKRQHRGNLNHSCCKTYDQYYHENNGTRNTRSQNSFPINSSQTRTSIVRTHQTSLHETNCCSATQRTAGTSRSLLNRSQHEMTLRTFRNSLHECNVCHQYSHARNILDNEEKRRLEILRRDLSNNSISQFNIFNTERRKSSSPYNTPEQYESTRHYLTTGLASITEQPSYPNPFRFLRNQPKEIQNCLPERTASELQYISNRQQRAIIDPETIQGRFQERTSLLSNAAVQSEEPLRQQTCLLNNVDSYSIYTTSQSLTSNQQQLEGRSSSILEQNTTDTSSINVRRNELTEDITIKQNSCLSINDLRKKTIIYCFIPEPNEETVCAICCLALKTLEPVRVLSPCMHLYHVTCIDQWFEKSSKCPICRRSLRIQDFPSTVDSVNENTFTVTESNNQPLSLEEQLQLLLILIAENGISTTTNEQEQITLNDQASQIEENKTSLEETVQESFNVSYDSNPESQTLYSEELQNVDDVIKFSNDNFLDKPMTTYNSYNDNNSLDNKKLLLINSKKNKPKSDKNYKHRGCTALLYRLFSRKL